MIARMIEESPTTVLCKSCGLCCTGHLFSWVRLNAPELDSAQALGLNVVRSDPRQRGFTQPCPVWRGICTVYTSPDYPRGCRTYHCKLLKRLIADDTSLSEALSLVHQTMEMIGEVESRLPASGEVSFRERLVVQMEQEGSADPEFKMKADALLSFFEMQFGVRDFFDQPVDD
jgi:hypothetical protein